MLELCRGATQLVYFFTLPNSKAKANCSLENRHIHTSHLQSLYKLSANIIKKNRHLRTLQSLRSSYLGILYASSNFEEFENIENFASIENPKSLPSQKNYFFRKSHFLTNYLFGKCQFSRIISLEKVIFLTNSLFGKCQFSIIICLENVIFLQIICLENIIFWRIICLDNFFFVTLHPHKQ